MKYDEEEAVWLICMFDLPTMTKIQRRDASRFRNNLLDLGFSMVQLSVYVKYSPTIGGTTQVYKGVQAIIPPQGDVSFLKVTEKQYSAMMRYHNDKPTKNDDAPQQLTLFDDF